MNSQWNHGGFALIEAKAEALKAEVLETRPKAKFERAESKHVGGRILVSVAWKAGRAKGVAESYLDDD